MAPSAGCLASAYCGNPDGPPAFRSNGSALSRAIVPRSLGGIPLFWRTSIMKSCTGSSRQPSMSQCSPIDTRPLSRPVSHLATRLSRDESLSCAAETRGFLSHPHGWFGAFRLYYYVILYVMLCQAKRDGSEKKGCCLRGANLLSCENPVS